MNINIVIAFILSIALTHVAYALPAYGHKFKKPLQPWQCLENLPPVGGRLIFSNGTEPVGGVFNTGGPVANGSCEIGLDPIDAVVIPVTNSQVQCPNVSKWEITDLTLSYEGDAMCLNLTGTDNAKTWTCASVKYSALFTQAIVWLRALGQ